MTGIYQEIARKNGVSVAEVKAEIQTAIAAACHGFPEGVAGMPDWRRKMAPEGKIPAPEEVVGYVIQQIHGEETLKND